MEVTELEADVGVLRAQRVVQPGRHEAVTHGRFRYFRVFRGGGGVENILSKLVIFKFYEESKFRVQISYSNSFLLPINKPLFLLFTQHSYKAFTIYRNMSFPFCFSLF